MDNRFLTSLRSASPHKLRWRALDTWVITMAFEATAA
jgi:hypothetical protein